MNALTWLTMPFNARKTICRVKCRCILLLYVDLSTVGSSDNLQHLVVKKRIKSNVYVSLRHYWINQIHGWAWDITNISTSVHVFILTDKEQRVGLVARRNFQLLHHSTMQNRDNESALHHPHRLWSHPLRCYCQNDPWTAHCNIGQCYHQHLLYQHHSFCHMAEKHNFRCYHLHVYREASSQQHWIAWEAAHVAGSNWAKLGIWNAG